LIKDGWSKEQTVAVVKSVNAVKPPRGYEKLFAIEKLQEIGRRRPGPDRSPPRLAVRAIERARADIRDVQFAG